MTLDSRDERPSYAKGIFYLVAGMATVALVLHAVAGPAIALAACALFAAALALTLIAQRKDDPSSRDAETGLPDRAAALRRLEEIAAQGGTARRQAALITVTFPDSAFADAEERRSVLLLAVLRTAQRLRKGDQILRTDTFSLAVILSPSRGLNARSVRDILDRLDGVLREPFRVGDRRIQVEAALGACLQNDAPAPDARSWLEAAEDAARVAGAKREPHVYWLALTPDETARWPKTPSGEDVPSDKGARSA